MQLDKLINVVSIGELSPAEAVERERLVLVIGGGRADWSGSQVIQLVGVFGGEVINVGTDRARIVMVAGRAPRRSTTSRACSSSTTSWSSNGRLGGPA